MSGFIVRGTRRTFKQSLWCYMDFFSLNILVVKPIGHCFPDILRYSECFFLRIRKSSVSLY